jgi:hypothetical protein
VTDEDRSAYLDLLRRLKNGDGDAYDLGRKLLGLSMQRSEGDWIYYPSWLLWGGLTDWVENKPEEKEQAAAAMVEAACEFLEVNGSATREREYFDRWLYERIGYQRPT